MTRLGSSLLVLPLVLLATACTSLPEAEELPEGPGEAPVVVAVAAAEETPGEEAAELVVKTLRLKDVRGGETTFELAGGPEEVATALLDFERASGHRAWAPRIEALEPEGQTLRSRWHFEGEMGIDPVVVLGFRKRAEGEGVLIRFRLLETDFGLAAFFGDYLIEAIPTKPGRSSVRARIFIDSGVTIANASDEEIAAGLREDARMLADWMAERLAARP